MSTKQKSSPQNPFLSKDNTLLWKEVMESPRKPVDKKAILRDLAKKKKTKSE